MNKKPIKIPSYIKKQLLPDEYVIYKLKPSWKIFIVPMAMLLPTLFVFYFCKEGKSDIEIAFCILCAISFGMFVSNFIMALHEYFEFLFLTNSRVIIGNFYKEINLKEIMEVTNNKDLPPVELRGLYWFVFCISFYNIIFYCKDNKNLVARLANIDKKDYNKFKRLLKKECKKQGNKIS